MIGYGKSVAKLRNAVSDMLEREDSGLIVFKSYTKFGDISVIQVVPL
jgi:glycerate-2-kinase